tara:strand:- start:6202 stop:7410 length:1209 start_codon:yes stop_codon:yes gene_type:complete
MINSVRNTVLAIINKNNYGYLSPNDFNLFAKQAQLDLFDEYFFQYNQQINDENSRMSGTGYADIKKGYEEVIDTFSATGSLAQTYTAQTTVASGTTTAIGGGNSQIIDATAAFTSEMVGDIVSITINNVVSKICVIAFVDATTLTTDSTAITTSAHTYFISKITDAAPGINNAYILPSSSTTGFDYYLLNKLLVYSSITATGTTTSFATAGNQIIDTGAAFTASLVGDKVSFILNNNVVTTALIIGFSSASTITIDSTSIIYSCIAYSIYKESNLNNEAELVNNSKITMLNNSLLTAPNLTYPAYTQEANNISLHPTTISSMGQVVAQYIRYPKDPNWTFTTISNGDPIFDQSQADYQDFELPLDDGNDLVSKILQYAGISIREGDVFKFGQVEERTQNQEQ